MRKENTRWLTPKQTCSQISTNENEKDEGWQEEKDIHEKRVSWRQQNRE